MIPLDWNLIVISHAEQGKATKPGRNAPTRAEHDELVKRYG